MNNKLNHNIRLDFVFRFLCNFAIGDGIFVLFLVKKGLPLWQIGILEGIFHATSIITEIPSGALADLIGRKKILLASRLCGVISTLIILLSDSMWMLGIGFVFSAWTFNLLSGSEEALLYDSFLALGKVEQYFKVNGRLSFIAESSQGLALLLGGYLAEISYVLCYIVMLVIDILAVMVCLFMKEPDIARKENSIKKHFVTSYQIIKGNRKLQYILFHYSVLFAFCVCVFLFSQKYYFRVDGLTEGKIGLILLAVSGCSSLGALFSEKISKKAGKSACFLYGLVSAVGLMLMGSDSLAVSIIGFAINSMAHASLYPLQSNELNKLIASEQRATIISVSSMCFSMIMIILFPVMGLAAGYIDMANIIFGMGMILSAYCVLIRFCV